MCDCHSFDIREDYEYCKESSEMRKIEVIYLFICKESSEMKIESFMIPVSKYDMIPHIQRKTWASFNYLELLYHPPQNLPQFMKGLTYQWVSMYHGEIEGCSNILCPIIVLYQTQGIPSDHS